MGLEPTRVLPPTVFKTATRSPTWFTLPIFFINMSNNVPLFWWDKGNPFFLTSKLFLKKFQKKNPELFRFRILWYFVCLTSYIVVKSFNKTSESVCEIRGYEQLLNCCFQITTFICLLFLVIFSKFCGISTLFLITITNLRKVYWKVKYFFIFF